MASSIDLADNTDFCDPFNMFNGRNTFTPSSFDIR